MAVILVFIDGIGIGPPDPEANPFTRAHARWLCAVVGWLPPTGPDAPLFVPVDACLGVPGLPQSATGQTALLTGINAPRTVGRHINGFCTTELAALLDGQTILSRVRARGGRATFANAYTPSFFEGKHRFPSVTTVATRQAGLRFRTLDDLRAGEAVFQDYTNRMLQEQGYDAPTLEPEEAGRRLARLAAGHEFTLYEYFQTDKAGHDQAMDRGVAILEGLDRLLGALLAHVDLERTLVCVASDHGNLEDLRTRRHTTNPVPVLLWGHGREAAAARLRDLTDIAPALLEWT
jgi:hypothetical protein